MHRRHFVKLSGISLAGLLTQLPAIAGEPTGSLLMLPEKAWLHSGDQLLQLTSTGGSKWTSKGAEVIIKQVNNALRVTLQAPGIPVNYIKLQWPIPINKQAQYLGDHWERTYGDTAWEHPSDNKKMPWYMLQHDGKSTQCFGVKTGANSICYWNISRTGLSLTLDTHSGGGGVELGDRVLHAADIVTMLSKPGERPFLTGQRFCQLMCEKPRLAKQPVYGINDWYFAYGKNSSQLIMEHTNLLADLATDTNNRPFSVIDAGWAKYSPVLPDDCCWQDDYSKSNEHFPDMAKLAADIKQAGMRPGLWTRPLCGAHDDSVNLLLPAIPGRDDAKKPVLDPTIDENVERVKRNVSTYRQWGFELVKHDFSTYDMLGKWGFEMTDQFTVPNWRFNDNTKTNAEIMLHLYRAIREAAGSMCLIGCNTVSHLSAGLFEINRIGDDTSGNEWDRTRKMGVNTLAFRGIQHNHFYAADADCVGLTNKVPWKQNKQWMQLLAESGTPLLISAQPDAVGAEQKVFIRQCFSTAAKSLPIGEPLDWLSTMTPNQWKLNGRIVKFDWR